VCELIRTEKDRMNKKWEGHIYIHTLGKERENILESENDNYFKTKFIYLNNN
jgi:hypothetical protein